MSDRKALLILHGKQALNEAVRTAVENQRERGWELAVRLTWEAGDAQRLVGEALAAGFDTSLPEAAMAPCAISPKPWPGIRKRPAWY